jgi:gluconokinase
MENNTSMQSPLESGVHVVLMGVAGSGKSTLAAQLAGAIDAKFFDADDFHPLQNVERMRLGIPLTDEDRAPWLSALNALLSEGRAKGERIVLACSALRASYRAAIAKNVANIHWVFLDGDFETIAARIRMRSERTDHYMPESLLKSQFDTLERPDDAITIDVALPTEAQLQCVLVSLRPSAESEC